MRHAASSAAARHRTALALCRSVASPSCAPRRASTAGPSTVEAHAAPLAALAYTTEVPRDAIRDSHTDDARASAAEKSPRVHRWNPRVLPEAPHGLPRRALFAIERGAAAAERQWVVDALPAVQRGLHSARHLPAKDQFWAQPPSDALEEIVARQPYSDSMTMIAEHSYFFLLEDAIFTAQDAPLPHVLYEDAQQALTFASLQRPPEQQFQLPARTLVTLLCVAAHHCTLDRHYFNSASLLFKKMEQQQHLSADVYSAYIYVCAAAGQVAAALATAEWLTAQRFAFSPQIFALMQHPALSVLDARAGLVPQAAKGLLLQERLGASLNTGVTPTAVVIHAMFVHYALTLQHTLKWELIRTAVHELSSPTNFVIGAPRLADRTLRLLVETFAMEKGVRCGPRTVMALLKALVAARSSAADSAEAAVEVLYILLRTRMNEATPPFASTLALAPSAFASDEQEELMVALTRQPMSRQDTAASRASHDGVDGAAPHAPAVLPIFSAPLSPTMELVAPAVRMLLSADALPASTPKTLIRALRRAARGGPSPRTAAAATVLEQLHYLDHLSATDENVDATRTAADDDHTASSREWAAVESQVERELQPRIVGQPSALDEARDSDESNGNGDDEGEGQRQPLPAIRASAADRGSLDGSATATESAPLSVEQAGWAARVLREEAEQRLLRQELDGSGAWRYL